LIVCGLMLQEARRLLAADRLYALRAESFLRLRSGNRVVSWEACMEWKAKKGSGL
jgi:hypothetical protein